MKTRAMTKKQFRNALARYGMKWTGFMGYVEIGRGVSVSVANVGKLAGYRAWLAYLLRERDRIEKEEAL